MVNIATIQTLFDHMEWADAEVWKAVLASSTATEDTKLQEVFYHLHATQRAFLNTWRDESLEGVFPKFGEARGIREWAIPYYGEAQAYINTLDETNLSQPMPLPWAAMVEKRFGRSPETTTIGETVLQVALHTTYHRGQVNARLRELGGEPPLVDYIAWIWQGRPAADWN